MHSLYTITALGDGKFRYTTSANDEVALFGRHSGIVCIMLRSGLPSKQGEHGEWHLDVRAGLDRLGHSSRALVINLKPKSAERNVSLYELIQVWGVSADGWTPMMLHLRGLVVDSVVDSTNVQDFVVDPKEVDNQVFSFTYRNGTIKDGELVGPWTSSGPSAANSVMLWPATLEYFMREARKVLDSVPKGER